MSVLAFAEVVAPAVLLTSTLRLEGVVVFTDAYLSPTWIEHHMYTVHSITHISISNHVPRSMLAVEEVVATAVSSTSTLKVVVVVTDAHVSPSTWIQHHMHTVNTVHKHFKSCTQVHAFFSCGGIRFHFVCID